MLRLTPQGTDKSPMMPRPVAEVVSVKRLSNTMIDVLAAKLGAVPLANPKVQAPTSAQRETSKDYFRGKKEERIGKFSESRWFSRVMLPLGRKLMVLF